MGLAQSGVRATLGRDGVDASNADARGRDPPLFRCIYRVASRHLAANYRKWPVWISIEFSFRALKHDAQLLNV